VPDLATYEDVAAVVRTQYDLLLASPQTAPHFSGVDLEHHLPRVYTFWAFTLGLGDASYRGSVFEPHARLKLAEEDYTVWQAALKTALEQNGFSGPVCGSMIAKARMMEFIFKSKLPTTDEPTEV
jgi:truncated hemoglobin YjbI